MLHASLILCIHPSVSTLVSSFMRITNGLVLNANPMLAPLTQPTLDPTLILTPWWICLIWLIPIRSSFVVLSTSITRYSPSSIECNFMLLYSRSALPWYLTTTTSTGPGFLSPIRTPPNLQRHPSLPSCPPLVIPPPTTSASSI